jgi:agmatine/peptidylarginine deiminase
MTTTSFDQLPQPLGRLPAEWEPQRALLVVWPHGKTDWSTELPAIERLYVKLVELVCLYQPMIIVYQDAEHQQVIQHHLQRLTPPRYPYHFIQIAINDTWVRDYGPLTVLDSLQRPVFVDFRFNGWGGKFLATNDDAVSAQLAQSGYFYDTGYQMSSLVLEGGAIETDGHGRLLVMRRTVIDNARNPGWTQAAIEQELFRLLGIDDCLWLEHGWLTGDDTDGHIDTLARFVDEQTICYAACQTITDPDYHSLQALHEELTRLRTRTGQPYRLLPIHQPAPIFDQHGQRLPATYINFIVLNRAIIVPIYDDPMDRQALHQFAQAFPHHTIHACNSRITITQGGSLHCLSMHLPAAVSCDSSDHFPTSSTVTRKENDGFSSP